MERELGAELFERQGRNVKLNKYGKLFLPYAQKSLNTLEAGENALKEYIDPNSGTIIIGGFYSIEAFTTDLMIRYHSETNRLGVQFQYSSEGWFNLQKHLLDGSMDLILCTKVNSPRVGSYYIGSHPLVALVSEQHRFAQRSSLKLEDFQGENFISFDSSGQISSRMKDIFEQKHLHVNIVTETPNDVIIYGWWQRGTALRGSLSFKRSALRHQGDSHCRRGHDGPAPVPAMEQGPVHSPGSGVFQELYHAQRRRIKPIFRSSRHQLYR